MSMKLPAKLDQNLLDTSYKIVEKQITTKKNALKA